MLRYPDGVFPIHVGERLIDQKVRTSLLAFLTLFLATLLGVTFVLSLTGLDLMTSLSGAATALCNVGPGLGTVIGPGAGALAERMGGGSPAWGVAAVAGIIAASVVACGYVAAPRSRDGDVSR